MLVYYCTIAPYHTFRVRSGAGGSDFPAPSTGEYDDSKPLIFKEVKITYRLSYLPFRSKRFTPCLIIYQENQSQHYRFLHFCVLFIVLACPYFQPLIFGCLQLSEKEMIINLLLCIRLFGKLICWVGWIKKRSLHYL